MATGTSNTNNQGIMHLSHQRGGKPLCGSRRAIMSTTVAEAANWPRICFKCAAKLNAMNAKRAAKAQNDAPKFLSAYVDSFTA